MVVTERRQLGRKAAKWRVGPAAGADYFLRKSALLFPPRTDPSARERVVLVDVGPGDLELLTVHLVQALNTADILVHDGPIDPRVLDIPFASAQRI